MSDGQLERLSLVLAVSTPPGNSGSGFLPNGDKEIASLIEHVEHCPECKQRIDSLVAVEMKIQQLRRMAAATLIRGPGCPDDDVWPHVVMDLVEAREAERHVTHAAQCAYCGPLLQEAREILADETTPQEQAAIDALAVSTPEWQHRMAAQMAAVCRAGPKPTVSPNISPTNLKTRWLRLPGPRFVWGYAAMAAVALIAFAGWYALRESPLHKTEVLLARSYAKSRTIDMRFPGADYAEVSVERGSRASFSADLLDAEVTATDGVAAHPGDPAWIAARANVDLLEGDYPSAVARFEQARKLTSASAAVSSAIRIGLASASYQAGDRKRAIELLTEVLKEQPNDPVALFNRATAAELDAPAMAIADWKHYLQIDPNSRWAVEARAKLDRLEH